MKKIKQGGARPGAGRKNKYGEETTTIALRVPISKSAEIKKIVSEKLKTYEVK